MAADDPSSAPPLKISGLAKSVPGGRRLFSNLALDMAPGEIVAIMGESGVGKSTLLNLVAGLDRADAGRIEIDGVDLSTLDDDARTGLRRDRIGFVFQAFHILPPWLFVLPVRTDCLRLFCLRILDHLISFFDMLLCLLFYLLLLH